MEIGDEQEDAEIYDDKVYSPPADTREGKERRKRREKIEKAGKLAERWKLMRECKLFLEENGEKWEGRKKEEGKIIERRTSRQGWKWQRRRIRSMARLKTRG